MNKAIYCIIIIILMTFTACTEKKGETYVYCHCPVCNTEQIITPNGILNCGIEVKQGGTYTVVMTTNGTLDKTDDLIEKLWLE